MMSLNRSTIESFAHSQAFDKPVRQDMYMALFSVRYGFIPTRISKYSYEPLGSARCRDQC